jgi:hypothetical protein
MLINIIGLIGFSIIIASSPLLKAVKKKLKNKSITLYNLSTCSFCIGFIIGFIYKISLFYGGFIGLLSYAVDLLLTIAEVNIFVKGGIKPSRDKSIDENEDEDK